MWQKSRNWTAKFGSALVLALVACSVTYAQDVRTNYMPGTDFSKYHTYAWVDEVQGVPGVGGKPDQILDTQVKQAIDSQMAGKGFTKVLDGKPDLLLGYQLAIDREKQINGFGSGWGGGWGGGGPWGGGLNSFSATTSTINIGTFVVGMYDPAAKKLVWIGAAQRAIEPSKKQEKNQERLNKGAQKLLKDFPPGRSK
jgi:hypothetical protein